MEDAIRNVETPLTRRAALLDGMLKAERWTRRKVALAIGTNPRYINDRMNGQVDLTFSDIEAIAPLLRMDGPQLFATLSNAAPDGDTQKGLGRTPAGWWFESTSGSHDENDVNGDAEVFELHPHTGTDAPERDRLAPVTTLHTA